MAEIKNGFQESQAGESAVKCLSQGHNRMAQVGLNQDHVDHNHGTLILNHDADT